MNQTGRTDGLRAAEQALRELQRLAAALLAGALLLSSAPALPVWAEETAEQAQESDGGFAERLEQEKAYLLEALDRLEEMGISPIAIWSKITKDSSVSELIGTVTQTAADTADAASEAASELGESALSAAADAGTEMISAAAEEITETVQEQVQEAQQGLMDRIREWLNGLLDGLLDGT